MAVGQSRKNNKRKRGNKKTSFSVSNSSQKSTNLGSSKRKSLKKLESLVDLKPNQFDELENYEYEEADIDEDEDEEIDEEEAFNEEDEEKYSEFFKKEESGGESEHDVLSEGLSEGDDGTDMEEEGMDISEMLIDHKNSSLPQDDLAIPYELQGDSEQSDDDLSEASNSSSDEIDDQEQAKPRMKMVKFIDELVNADANTFKKKKTSMNVEERNEVYTESEFHINQSSKPEVKMEDLLRMVDDNSMFASLKSNVSKLDNAKLSKKKIDAPLPQRLQDKITRKAAYEQTNKELEKWQPIVEKNRQADHLNFAVNRAENTIDNSRTLIREFKPTSNLEKEIDQLVRDSGLDDKTIQQQEELELQKLTPEEIKIRREELRTMRELLFRDEMKQKRLAKIKSKTYRKILKKEKERNALSLDELKELNGDVYEEERLKHERERIKERMTLRHKAGSKWSKSMLNRDGEEGRQALNEHFQRHENLRKKIQGLEDSEDEHLEENDLSGTETNDPKSEASFFLNKIEKEMDQEKQESASTKGVFGMKFMQRALSQKQEEAKRMLDELRKDIEQCEFLSEDEEKGTVGVAVQNNPGRRVIGTNLIADGKIVESEGTKKEKNVFQDSNIVSMLNGDLSGRESHAAVSGNVKVKMRQPQKKEIENNSESNPWLDVSKSVTATPEVPKITMEHHSIKKKETEKVESKKQLSNEISFDSEEDEEEVEWTESESEGVMEPGLKQKGNEIKFNQKELIARAFAGDDLIEEEFSKEKQERVEGDMGKEEDLTLPGWGSWGGTGLKPVQKKVIKQVPGIEETKRQDFKREKVIINEKESKKLQKYKVGTIPYPYQTREQYEKAIRVPLGKEWNSRQAYQTMSKPRVVTRTGQVIHPITLASTY